MDLSYELCLVIWYETIRRCGGQGLAEWIESMPKMDTFWSEICVTVPFST